MFTLNTLLVNLEKSFESILGIFVFNIISVNNIKGNKDGKTLFINNNRLFFVDAKFSFENTINSVNIIKKYIIDSIFFIEYSLYIFMFSPYKNICVRRNYMRYSKYLKDYMLLDMADGNKLEKWGNYTLVRPDPQIVWKDKTNPKLWNMADATYIRSSTGGGSWKLQKKLPASWKIKYRELTFNIKPMGFKHTGLFPEQSVNWDYMMDKIFNCKRDIKVLNLFSYTGGATVACLFAGASVCHVDSSQGMVNWAKENVISSGLEKRPVRFIVDDVVKFVKREIRRGNKYDVIIMDPPSYGRGKNGEVWNIEKDLYPLMCLCNELLSDNPLFLLVNTYTGGLSGTIISNVVQKAITVKNKKISFDEIGLKQEKTDIFLPCGITTICEFNN